MPLIFPLVDRSTDVFGETSQLYRSSPTQELLNPYEHQGAGAAPAYSGLPQTAPLQQRPRQQGKPGEEIEMARRH